VRKVFFIFSAFLFATSALAQKQPAVVSVHGNCNGSATGDNIKVTVNCNEGLSKQQADALAGQYAKLLQTIQHGSANDSLKFDDIIQRLKNLQSGMENLEGSAKGRRLTPDQMTHLTALATSLSLDKDVFKFDFYGSDAETAAYAGDFAKAFGINTDKIPVTMQTAKPITGVYLEMSHADYLAGRHQPACEALANFLVNEHLQIVPSIEDHVESGHCEMFIGYKPVL
jgi:hypothetical protein